MDPAFLSGLYLWYRARQHEKLTAGESALAGGLVAFGVTEGASIVLGHYQGWLALSHGLSSIPMALAAFTMLLYRERRRSLAWPWAGALTLIALFTPQLLHGLPPAGARPFRTKTAAPAPSGQIPVLDAAAAQTLCGVQNLAVHVTPDIPSSAELSLESCGVRPALVRPSAERLHLKNSSAHAANIHFVIFQEETQRMGWNLVLLAGASLNSPPIHLRRGEVGLLYSDSSPSAGLALVVPSDFSSALTLRAARLPLVLREDTP